jgi:alpha-tubulin suppressor-like RCC1 family protein
MPAGGDLVVWGNGRTPAWVPPTLAGEEVTAIAAGESHSMALLKLNGTVVTWGSDTHGQVSRMSWLAAHPRQGDPVVAIAAGKSHCMGLTKLGIVVAWGRGNEGQTAVPDALKQANSGVVAIAAGHTSSFAITANGSVIAWGKAVWDMKPLAQLTGAGCPTQHAIDDCALHPCTGMPLYHPGFADQPDWRG